ncbi:SDR family oxidoreductase [Gorillibacterium massiliense]|uniref:SDR family oxidoreductase n=1 Tax=Gorillibacterium massiliense TaxID=1280390 RepID=UPI0004AE01BF|nr:SDR family oxidoreductase [Gorillibacterium massiliense]
MEKPLAVVTGANSGMGLATTIELAKRGYRVVMACRHVGRGQDALAEAFKQSSSGDLDLMICDLGSLAGIRSFAAEFNRKYDKVDVLINNAGVVSIKRQETSDGFEAMMGVNHLGHFLLTNQLLPNLQRAEQGRIVVVSSGAHKIGSIRFADPYFNKGFTVWNGYAQSKLANILFTKELARRLQDTKVTVNCLHPGAVATSIGVDRKTGFGKRIMGMTKAFFLSPAEGADTAIYLGTSPDVRGVRGEYFYKRKIAPVSKNAKDPQLAAQFWAWSEHEVGLDE